MSRDGSDGSAPLISLDSNYVGALIKLFQMKKTNAVMGAVSKGKISIKAVDPAGTGLLHFAAANIKDEVELAEFVSFFASKGGDLNQCNNYGQTALDNCFNESRKKVLREFGCKPGSEVSNVQALLAAASILPGYEESSDIASMAAAIRGFTFETKELVSVEEFLADAAGEEAPMAYQDPVDLSALLSQVKGSVGQLFSEEEFVGTVALIKDDWIITARHVVNFSSLSDLKVVFTRADGLIESSIVGVVESGEESATTGLDYIILKLEKPIEDSMPVSLSGDSASTSLLFLGYAPDDELCFSAFPNENPGQLLVMGYQQTGGGVSGGIYLDLDGHVCALHLRASTTVKSAVYINTILESKPTSVIKDLNEGVDVSSRPSTAPTEIFPSFIGSMSELSEFDEGVNRTRCLGKNPNVGKDELGGARNIVCKEVLFRWALKGKARYAGVKANRIDWLSDWENWEVSVRKTNEGPRKWVKLSKKRTAKSGWAIQMGHKLSAVEFFVHGVNIEKMIGKFGAGKKEVKRVRYTNRYSLYTKPGHKYLTDEPGDSLTNRKFMYQADNYRFEYAELNEENGRAEGKTLMFTMAPKSTDIYKQRRKTLDTRDKVSEAVKTSLDTRAAKLAEDSNKPENHTKFVKK